MASKFRCRSVIFGIKLRLKLTKE